MGSTTQQNPQPDTSKKVVLKNSVLQWVSKTHIAVPITIFFIYAIGLVYWGLVNTSLRPASAIILFLIGLFVFTLVEYLMHRYVFHMATYTKLRQKIQYGFHGIHHANPKDKSRLAMPPIMSVTISTALLFILKFFMQDSVFGFLPGFLAGYSSYLFVHYIVHAYPPPKNLFKVLWIHHAIHHYKDPERAFGVSSTFWDHVFRTMPK